MFSMFLSTLRFFKYLYLGLKQDAEFRLLFLLLILLQIGSTTFYCHHENWPVIDALYFSVMTMSTIGYGDLTPTTPISKIFTIIYTFLSIGTFATITTKIVTVALSDLKNFHLIKKKKGQ